MSYLLLVLFYSPLYTHPTDSVSVVSMGNRVSTPLFDKREGRKIVASHLFLFISDPNL